MTSFGNIALPPMQIQYASDADESSRWESFNRSFSHDLPTPPGSPGVSLAKRANRSSLGGAVIQRAPSGITAQDVDEQLAGTAFLSPDFVRSQESARPETLTLSDPIYGTTTISEPVLIALVLSPAIQRLKDVLQHGITGLLGLTPSPAITRLEHSIGAMRLVRRAGGSTEAQAAALLHDVAHTALSHVVDRVWGYVVHEEDKWDFLRRTTIPLILASHRLVPSHVLEEANFSLLELDAPALCADRLDYGLRDSLRFGTLSLTDAQAIARDLVCWGGRFCMQSKELALTLGRAYMESDKMAWCNPLHGVMYEYAAQTIRLACETGILAKSDLWLYPDAPFWARLAKSDDPHIAASAAKVRSDLVVVEIHPDRSSESALKSSLTDSEDAKWQAVELVTLSMKVRTLDPDVAMRGTDGEIERVIRLSDLDPTYKSEREEHIRLRNGSKSFRVYIPRAALPSPSPAW
ncbi:uncharacterized protein L969DRAFT_16494 [Mixia osmundae IAM 14324]|uniref:HD/PDEase domain-containing protein n=1 Tax=Mixia osmundae (strain CBS 9802 / IAM 14324 / JCM 22182 / KY 12970) TaxID=764103 RepID=G7E974_MIXOS|nr:uncharacterized protein L969DRAFT_16494 [Mixia osmundae IAM 14324]KEI39814.1 hypothetical protein L969DRAFT_16494 [Mixia osmundae IAM 14324]GAA99193.1 hypothetical protein E5Q_05885 [Mixia osmundae IAM 14324]